MRLSSAKYVGMFLLAALVGGPINRAAANAVVTLNPSITYQTITGWESAILPTVLDYRNFNTPAFQSLLDQAVNEVGMVRLQLGVYGGMENTSDSSAGYLNGTISEGQWTDQFLYKSVNDNDDPRVVNEAGFHWAILDWEIDNLVLGIKKRVEARGGKLYTYVSYTDYKSSSFEHWQHPEEYAEFMLALFDHMRAKYGFVPDGINVINEPGYANDWTGTAIGRVIAATGPRLAAAHYTPDFMAPSTMDMGKAPQFIDEIVAVPGAAQYVKEISYHRYRLTGGLNSLKEIAERAKQLNAATVMNEWWAAGNSYRTLHQDLKIGNNSAWQQAAVGGKNGYTTIDPKTQSVSLTARTKFMLPYYKNIKPGAKRIEATTTASKLDPISFINRDGKYVVIIKAESAGTVSIRNLPPAVYGISYTTLAQFDKRAADVTVLGGRDLEASIPSSGVLSVYSK